MNLFALFNLPCNTSWLEAVVVDEVVAELLELFELLELLEEFDPEPGPEPDSSSDSESEPEKFGVVVLREVL